MRSATTTERPSSNLVVVVLSRRAQSFFSSSSPLFSTCRVFSNHRAAERLRREALQARRRTDQTAVALSLRRQRRRRGRRRRRRKMSRTRVRRHGAVGKENGEKKEGLLCVDGRGSSRESGSREDRVYFSYEPLRRRDRMSRRERRLKKISLHRRKTTRKIKKKRREVERELKGWRQ